MGIRRRVLRLVCRAVVTAGVIVFAGYRYADFPFAAATLGKEWERAKKNGIALESKDLLPDPAVIDGDNAALELIPLSEQADASVKAAERIPDKPGVSAAERVWAENHRIYQAVEPFLARFTSCGCRAETVRTTMAWHRIQRKGMSSPRPKNRQSQELIGYL